MYKQNRAQGNLYHLDNKDDLISQVTRKFTAREILYIINILIIKKYKL
jgi:hypothetical protein